MADIKHITLPNGDTHDIKDATIRDEVRYKIYDSVSDLGLTVGSATIAGAYAAMPTYSILLCQQGDFANSELPLSGAWYGQIEIIKMTAGGGSFFAHGVTTYGDFRMYLGSGQVPTGVWVAQDYSFVKEGVTVFRNGRLRIVRLDSPSAWCATLYAEDTPSSDARVLSKVFNGSDYVDCNVSVGADGTVKVLSLWGSEIAGAQYNFLLNKYVTYFV